MDREEAIDLLDNLIGFIEDNHSSDYDKALKMAIEALKQEPRKDEVILTKEEYGELVSSEFDNGYAKGYREALEEEPCVEPLERLAESASKTAKALERLKVSEQEPIEVEATKLQMAYNQGFEDCRKAVMDLLNETGKFSLLAMVADLAPVNPQEPKTIQEKQAESEKYQKAYDDGYEQGYAQARFDYEQEPKTGHWIYDKTIENWRCSKCNETPKTMGYVGTADFMAEHFKFCNHCGCRMVEPKESESDV